VSHVRQVCRASHMQQHRPGRGHECRPGRIVAYPLFEPEPAVKREMLTGERTAAETRAEPPQMPPARTGDRGSASSDPGRSDPAQLPAGTRAALLVTVGAIALTLGVAAYGLFSDLRNVALAGVGASVVVAVAVAVRGRNSIRTARHSAELLDSALAESERARDELYSANEKLQRTNADLRTLQIAVAQGFSLIDERTRGHLREVVEQAGAELAALVDETLDEETGGQRL
jgi:hypothetical protein